MYRIASPHGTGIYTAVGGGMVEVELDGRWGRFDENGVWLEGDLRIAEPGMCRWVATAGNIPTRHAESVAAAMRPATGDGEPS